MLLIVTFVHVGRRGCESLCERRRKVEEISAFFYHVADSFGRLNPSGTAAAGCDELDSCS